MVSLVSQHNYQSAKSNYLDMERATNILNIYARFDGAADQAKAPQ